MFFIGFPILSYPIRPHSITCIGYTKPYAKPSQTNSLSSYIQIVITKSSYFLYTSAIFQLLPSKHLLVLKTSSKTSWASWRRLEDVLQRNLEDILEDKKLLQKIEDMSWRCPEDMSWRHFQDVLETKKWEYLYLTNLNVYVSNKSILHKSISGKSKANPKSWIRTQQFQYSFNFEIRATFLFWELKS